MGLGGGTCGPQNDDLHFFLFFKTDGMLQYRRSFSKPYLLCIHPEAVDPFSKKLYEGICGNHIEGRSLSHRTLTQEYWWPNMQKEAHEYMKKYDQC